MCCLCRNPITGSDLSVFTSVEGAAAAVSSGGSTIDSDSSSSSIKGVTVHLPPHCFNPEWVVLIKSSTYFCKSDLQRLLVHTDADMTCGMDMHVAEPSLEPQEAAGVSSTVAATLDAPQAPSAADMVNAIRRKLLHDSDAPHLPSSTQATTAFDSSNHSQWQEATAAAAEWHERPPALDVWKHPVIFAGASNSRMLNGLPFAAAPFYANRHSPTLRRLVAGLPTQVMRETGVDQQNTTLTRSHCFFAGLVVLAVKKHYPS